MSAPILIFVCLFTFDFFSPPLVFYLFLFRFRFVSISSALWFMWRGKKSLYSSLFMCAYFNCCCCSHRILYLTYVDNKHIWIVPFFSVNIPCFAFLCQNYDYYFFVVFSVVIRSIRWYFVVIVVVVVVVLRLDIYSATKRFYSIYSCYYLWLKSVEGKKSELNAVCH